MSDYSWSTTDSEDSAVMVLRAEAVFRRGLGAQEAHHALKKANEQEV